MALCHEYRISHSHFLGGPPRWTESDQDKALAYEELRRSKCGNCGTRLEEWEEDHHAYVAHSWRCPGCEVLEMEKENVPEEERGIQIGVIPRRLSEQIEAAEAARQEGS